MKKKMQMAIDMDNVIFDFEGDFCSRIGTANRHLYKLEDRYPDFADDIAEYVNNPETYRGLFPVMGTLAWMQELKWRGFEILLLTSRPSNCHEVTLYQLKEWNVPYNHLQFAKDKRKLLQNYPNCVALLDDLPQNLENLPKWVRGVIFDRPWNTGFGFPRAKYDNDMMKMVVKPSKNEEWRLF